MNMKGNTKNLEELVEKTVRRVIREEFDRFLMELNSKFVPYVSSDEQKEIEKTYGKEPKSKKIVKEEKTKI